MCVSVCRTANIWNRVATAVCNSMVCDDQYRYLFVLHVLMHVSAISPSIHKQICRKCSAKSLSHLYKWSVALTDLTCSIKIIVATHFHKKSSFFQKSMASWPESTPTCHLRRVMSCHLPSGQYWSPTPGWHSHRAWARWFRVPPWKPSSSYAGPACSSICIYN